MVAIREYTKKSGAKYLCIYHGNKFIKFLGRTDKFTFEQLNYLKRKYQKLIKEGKISLDRKNG
jgi:hypothetical protein